MPPPPEAEVLRVWLFSTWTSALDLLELLC